MMCDCPTEDYVCNSTVGCVCKFGALGENCSFPNPNINSLAIFADDRLIEDEAESKSSKTAVTVICLLAVLILAFCAFIILKYKSKVHKLKNELNYVTYAVSGVEGGSVAQVPDRFENPIYTYQSDTKIMGLNNDYCKSNSEKSKLGFEAGGACGGASTSGNLTLNVYNSIDDFKTEPIYDEIKPMSAEEEEMEDNLSDRSSPPAYSIVTGMEYDTPTPRPAIARSYSAEAEYDVPKSASHRLDEDESPKK